MMAWVKLDDQAPRNEKLLKAGPAACWLWVCGIAHAQSQLTDGFISETVLPMIGIEGRARATQLAAKLIEAGLFERVEGGFQIHDYLDYNAPRSAVLTKRAEDANRKKGVDAARNPEGLRAESDRSPDGRRADSGLSPEVPARASHPIPSDPFPSDPSRSESARRSGGAPPLNLGLRRLKVWKWMLDELIDTLGEEHAAAFDIEAWLQALDANETRVLPNMWPWLKTEMLAEAGRRGLPVALAGSSLGKANLRLAAAVADCKAGRS